MSEIEISVNQSDPGAIHGYQQLLVTFKEQHRADVSLVTYTWEQAWAAFMEISLYGHGPVISQTGNSWMGSLTAHNSLRIFKDREVAELGGQGNFLPGSWQSCLDFDNKSVVAIPWSVDTCLVYYRRDLLAKAGVDEATAFSSAENFHSTLEKLQQNGVSHPYAVSTIGGLSDIHLVASWIWGQGGDFTDPEGTRVLFSMPETRIGMKKYFDLFRFMPPDAKHLNSENCLELLMNGQIAVTMRSAIKPEVFSAAHSENIGTAAVPGVPVLGGSHLIVWKHIRSHQEQDALALIKFLTSTDVALTLYANIGLIPARLAALEQIPPGSIFAATIQSVKTGRAFPRIRMWGLIEDKLVIATTHIWKTLLATPNPDVAQVITTQLDPIEERLNLTLSQ